MNKKEQEYEEFVKCPECGEEQGDFGNNVSCENCGYGPMPTCVPKS